MAYTLKDVNEYLKEKNITLEKGITKNKLLKGMNIENEHKNLIGHDAIKAAMIAHKHLKERDNYYELLKKYVDTPVKRETTPPKKDAKQKRMSSPNDPKKKKKK